MKAFLRGVKGTVDRIARILSVLGTIFLVTLFVVNTFVLDSPDSPNSERLYAKDFGDDWPFTTDTGLLICRNRHMILFGTKGKVYALNGIAAGRYPQVHPIWRDNPALPGTKINVGPLIDRAQKLCNASG